VAREGGRERERGRERVVLDSFFVENNTIKGKGERKEK
jgi:hypothetical protein